MTHVAQIPFIYILHRHITIYASVAVYVCLLMCNTAMAQNNAARYEINAKRSGIVPTDKDALPRGREFVRLDSTYYVGWMFQGLFLQDRSADRSGFQRALPLTRNAFLLLENDYSPALQSVYNNMQSYMQNNRVYTDYLSIAKGLRECYEYLDMPDSAMWVLQKIKEKGFKRDEYGLYGTMAWLIHRNRYYTDGRYPFLQPTVAENERLALQACYDGFGNIDRNQQQNAAMFGPYQSESDRHYLYHYLAMIHSYMKQYDSSEYYYNMMAEWGTISWNNYGSMKLETGYFENAAELYTLDKDNYGGDKRLMEPYYYLPMLSIYAGRPMDAIRTAQEAIDFSQSSPGFGWYNIALARAYLYNGQLDSADVTLTKADNFKEVHIGTTLSQPQYDFTISLLRLVWYQKKIASIKIADKGWWYKPSLLYKIASLAAKRYADKYVLASLLAENPERDRIIYDLFCGESTVGFDEIYTIMQSFSPRYFTKLLQDKSDTDPRQAIQRYFELGRAKMMMEQGNKKSALAVIAAIIKDNPSLSENEKLFMARVYELKAMCSEGAAQQEALNAVYELFPELIPFSGIEMRMALQVSGADDEAMTNKIYKALEKTGIEWVEANENVPAAALYIVKKNNKYEVIIDTRSAKNVPIVLGEKIQFESTEGLGEELLMRIFGKKGSIEYSNEK